MPRATRSKKIVIAEDEDTAAASEVPLPDTPGQARPVLAEISHNVEEETMTVEEAEVLQQLKGLKAAYKTAIGGKKNKKGKGKNKVKHQLELVSTGSAPDVVEDQQPAVVSPATEGARQLLSSDEEDLPSTEEEKQKTPPSAAVRATRQQLAKAKAGQFETEISLPTRPHSGIFGKHRSFSSAIDSPSYGRSIKNWMAGFHTPSHGQSTDMSYEVTVPLKERKLDKDGDIIMIQSPTKTDITTLESVEKACEVQETVTSTTDEAGEDSFVEQITARSPAKPITRIEDSVEELDKMEEVIEALNQAAIVVSPPDTVLTAAAQKKTAKATAKPFASLRIKSQDGKRNLKALAGIDEKGTGLKRAKSNLALRDSLELLKERTVVAQNRVKRPASLLPPKEPVKSSKPATQPTFELPGEAIARKLREQREARKAQREANEGAKKTSATAFKVKSAKPLTKPTFELPGEALSRKKREAHEARIKAQEEEEKKRREFKAKPLRMSVAPDFVPRETVASRARKSQIGLPEGESCVTAHQLNGLTVNKRTSIIGAHRPSIQAANLANMSAPRAPGLATSSQAQLSRKPSTTSGPSMSGLAMQRTVSANEVQLQRQRAKEIYKRDVRALEEMEREKREREAAAKKSRLEAAERGRQASREWAEKQRAKKAAEGDKGMSAGYGPGGQLGLKA